MRVEPIEHEETQQPSTLDQIRELYRSAQGDRRLRLPVPGKMGRYVKVRYQARDDFEDVEGRTGRDTNLDILIHACDAILVRVGDSWEPLTTPAGDAVLFYPTELNELLGIDVRTGDDGGTAREAALALFAGAPIPHAAVADHVTRLARWMQTGQHRVDEEELLGES
jgi:hypothetical protein